MITSVTGSAKRLTFAPLDFDSPVTGEDIDSNGLAHCYAMCSAWWHYEYESAHGRLNNDLSKILHHFSATVELDHDV